jgi:hypothetical protein
MKTEGPIALGEVVRVTGGTKEGRPGVVVRVFERDGRVMVLVPWGTGTLRADRRHVLVRPGTAAGTTLGIEKPTYFYPNNVTPCTASGVERLGRRCPPSLLAELEALIGM